MISIYFKYFQNIFKIFFEIFLIFCNILDITQLGDNVLECFKGQNWLAQSTGVHCSMVNTGGQACKSPFVSFSGY